MSTIERGFAHIIKDLGGSKRSWESQPPWVSDGSKYVPYIYSRDETKKCHRVQVGLVGAVIYDTGVVEIYDPELKEVRVKDESWEVWSAGKKAILNIPITWSVVENSTGIYITREQTTSKPDGVLRIVYSFIVGARLKHTVTWTSAGVTAVTVQVKQVHLMDFDKVTTDTGVSTASKSEKSVAYLFGYGSKGFWLFENQYAMVYDTKSLTPGTLLTEKCLQSGEIDFAGKKVTYTFGDWTLASGESLEIDPDTATLNDPTEDGMVWRDTDYIWLRNNWELYVMHGLPASGVTAAYRGYYEWDVSSIPDTATITDTVFKYHGNTNYRNAFIKNMLTQRPSTTPDTDAGNQLIWNAIGYAGGKWYSIDSGFPIVGATKSNDLGSDADTDLKAQLSLNWFCIGVLAVDESGYTSSILSENYASSNPKPTLYVEYSLPSAAGGLKMIPSLKGHMGYDLKTRGGKARRRMF